MALAIEQNANLAPAAGSGIGKMVADALLAEADFIPAMKAALMGGLTATIYTRTGMQPDFRTRLQAFVSVMAHMEGDPIKRIIHQHLNDGDTKQSVVDALQDSPALLESVKRVIANAEFKDRNKRKRGSVEVSADEVPE